MKLDEQDFRDVVLLYCDRISAYVGAIAVAARAGDHALVVVLQASIASTAAEIAAFEIVLEKR